MPTVDSATYARGRRGQELRDAEIVEDLSRPVASPRPFALGEEAGTRFSGLMGHGAMIHGCARGEGVGPVCAPTPCSTEEVFRGRAPRSMTF